MTSTSSTTSGSIPPSIEQFLLERVATHEQLQSLLWLLQHCEEAASAAELEPQLGISALELEEALGELVDAQLVTHAGDSSRYRYAPAGSDLDAKARLLAILHEQDRFEVVRVMGENAMKRMWNAARIAFLEALSESSLSGSLDSSRPEDRGRPSRNFGSARDSEARESASPDSGRLDGKRRSNAPEPAWKMRSRRDAAKTAAARKAADRLHR